MAARPAFNLRLPLDLRRQAEELAQRDGLSLNALCVMAIRSHVEFKLQQLAKQRRRAGLPISDYEGL